MIDPMFGVHHGVVNGLAWFLVHRFAFDYLLMWGANVMIHPMFSMNGSMMD